MEGGFLPWKNQKIVNNCPELDYFSKSLPPPPSGQYWERDFDGNWKLVSLATSTKEDGTMIFTQPSIIEHTVMSSDTLQGLCLKYRASATDIRRMNIFSGNNIQMKTKLLIPVNAGAAIQPQIETQEVILQKFKNVTQEETKEAYLYLEEHHWNLENAIAAWRYDNQWEEYESKNHHDHRKNFSVEVNSEVVAPLAIEEVPIVTAYAVSYSVPVADTSESHDRYNARVNPTRKHGFSLFRPLLRR